MKKKRIADGLRAWIEARKRHHLSHAQVQMAREQGLNPKKLGGLDNHRQERWKLPLPVFIEELYGKGSDALGPNSSCRSRNMPSGRKRRERSSQPAAKARLRSAAWTCSRGDPNLGGDAENDDA